MPLLFADNFLAGSLLTLLMPTLLLCAIAVWYVVAVRRVPKDVKRSAVAPPSPETVAAAKEATADSTSGAPPAAGA